MYTFRFTLTGKPIPKARPRMTRRGHVYTPDTTVQHETLLAYVAKKRIKEPTTKPVSMTVRFYMPIPKSVSKVERERLLKFRPHVKKPDLDNLVKLVKDALNGIVYKDDSQVHQLTATKEYSADPRTIVFVTWE